MVDSPNNEFYACGASLRVQDKMGPTIDDTSANGLDIVYCHRKNWFQQKSSMVWEGDYGKWGPYIFCPINQYITGAQVRAEYPSGVMDDAALNGLKVFCKDPRGT